ncbi:MAG: aldo/keto reductase [Acidobacteria bacterium]|nr:aldo/keto reductase [Acidobacteriota bacterium]
MKLGLGTVQFGLDYGIANRDGQTSLSEAAAILEFAETRGIEILDTAASYGCSEEILGQLLPHQHSFSIVTKTPIFRKSAITDEDAETLELTFLRSLQRLRHPKVYGLLMHHASDLLAEGGWRLFERMLSLQQRGFISRVGVSVYSAREIDEILSRYQCDLIQAPINVFDQRLLADGHLQRLKQKGIEIHARSIFLQGLLLMNPKTLPPYFDRFRPCFEKYHAYLKQQSLSPAGAALGFALRSSGADAVIYGVNTLEQLRELCHTECAINPQDFLAFAIDDPALVDPSNWRLVS